MDAVTGQTTEYGARVIFLCASALNSKASSLSLIAMGFPART